MITNPINQMIIDLQSFADSSYNAALKSVSNDLFHFDCEKQVRIIYIVNGILKQNPENPELVTLLGKVLDFVRNFKF